MEVKSFDLDWRKKQH